MTGVTVSRFHTKVLLGTLMICMHCRKCSLLRMIPDMPVLRTLYAWNHLDKSVWIGHDVATQDMIQEHLTTHAYFSVTLAKYMWFSTQHLVTLTTNTCDSVYNVSHMWFWLNVICMWWSFLKSFLFVCGGGAVQKIATQGCDLRARLAICSDLWDSPIFKPCTNRLGNFRSTLNIINSHPYEPRVHFEYGFPPHFWRMIYDLSQYEI